MGGLGPNTVEELCGGHKRRWDNENEKATEGNEWQTEATKVWVDTLLKAKEVFYIHQLVAET